jgi:hypothetical protein
MNLYEATRELHHSAEEHPLAKAMMDGSITDQQWCDWLYALWVVHTAIDPHVPECVRRAPSLQEDLWEILPLVPNQSKAAKSFAVYLDNPIAIGGAAYIFIGAHRRGGRVIKKAMEDAGRSLPNNHTMFFDNQSSELFVRKLRNYPELAPGAKLAFSATISIMDEVYRGSATIVDTHITL